MKIVFLATKPIYGGGERIFHTLMSEFSRHGHDVLVYSWEQEWKTVEGNAPFKISVLKTPPVGLKGKINAYFELKRSLCVDKPDCVLVFSLDLAEIMVLAAKSLDIPCICSERVDPYYLPSSLLHRFLRLITYGIASGVVFQTEEVRKFFPRQISRKSVVIPNPLMDDKLPNPSIDASNKEIIAVGRLSEEKNFGMLIMAFAEIASEIPDYNLKIFGDGPLYEILSERIQFINMTDRIFLMGRVTRVVEHIKDSDIFVLPSKHEGMPNVLIEAMAMGLACVSTDFKSGGANALIVNNENGVLIPVDDVGALKTALLGLILDTPRKKRIKEKALSIRKTHSKEIIFPKWIEYLESFFRKR